MLTVTEVAERLSLSRQCVYSLIDSGRLIAHRFGLGRGTIRVSEKDLAAYVAACRERKADKPKWVRRPRLKHIQV